MRLNFKKVYEKYLRDGSKRTTCRLGDKSKRYYLEMFLDLCVGSRYNYQIIRKGIITNVKIKPFGEITEQDLVYESPDCRSVEGLRCVMFHINKKILEDSDLVTLITWSFI